MQAPLGEQVGATETGDETGPGQTPEDRPIAAEQVAAIPPAVALTWDDDDYQFTPLDPEAVRARAHATPQRFTAYLDCGVWTGDEGDRAYARTFGVVCGRTVCLCEFRNDAPFTEVDAPPEESVPLNRALRALAGPQRLDVQVLRTVRSPVPVDLPGVSEPTPARADRGERVYVFLPDLHIPLVPRMPTLDPNLVPDPTKATCFCHGPVMRRILYGDMVTPEYAAVGCAISRDPNEWFYLMADRYRTVADDLVKFLSRLGRHGQQWPVHLVQLGALFEIWAGYDLVFHATGRAGQVTPRILRGAHLELFAREWSALVRASPNREAIHRFLKFPAADRTALQDDYEFSAREVPLLKGMQEQRSLQVASLFYAEHHPRPCERALDAPPVGFMALLEQQARFLPWQRRLTPRFRGDFMAFGVEWLRALDNPPRPAAYVMAHTHIPCLSLVAW